MADQFVAGFHALSDFVIPFDDYPAPLISHRKVRFGDSDSARIAYTVRLFDYSMEALEDWFETVLGLDWYRMNTEFMVGTPFVHAALDMSAPVKPGDVISVTVRVLERGNSSLRFQVTAVRQDGVAAFGGEWVCSLVDTTVMKSIPIPPQLAARIDEYQQRCGVTDEQAASV